MQFIIKDNLSSVIGKLMEDTGLEHSAIAYMFVMWIIG